MPLLDHFHPPIYPLRSWGSFHSGWANSIADALQRILPRRYFAEVQIHLGTSVEADVAEFETTFSDDFAVQVRDQRENARLVAVVELVSPRNKDRQEARRDFAIKCGAYLQRGIGVIVADVISNRQGNMHNELMRLLDLGEATRLADDVSLYTVAYRPAQRKDQSQIDIWPVGLAVGGSLPVLPLALRGSRAIPLDLEATYMDARQRSGF